MRYILFAIAALLCASTSWAQTPVSLTWDQVRLRFEQNNPTLQADEINVEEAKADETTAYLRPNPDLNLTVDGTQVAPSHGVWQPFAGTYESPGISYLHERRHKRELRLESAKKGTLVAQFSHSDLYRTLLFDLRSAFVLALQAKAVLQLAKDNLAYYDHLLEVSRTRFQAGDIAQIDLDRLELQRVQYQSDLQTAEVNVRSAKIQLLTLLNDRTPVEQFEVAGPYDFSEQLAPRENFHNMAMDARPDLKAAIEAIDKAQSDHKLAMANGSTDPTIAAWYTHNSSNNNPFGINTVGGSVNFPLRIFDRNQGEKLRTKLDITRTERLRAASEAQVFSDVDSAYAGLESSLALLRPYKQKYLQQAVRVRDTVAFAYQQGGASLLEFLSAQGEYRAVEFSYINLIGSYLVAAAQLNLAVGREVMP